MNFLKLFSVSYRFLAHTHTHTHKSEERDTSTHEEFQLCETKANQIYYGYERCFSFKPFIILLLIHFLFFSSSFFFFMPLKCSIAFDLWISALYRGEYEQDFTISIGYFPFTDCTVSRNGPFIRLLIYYERMVLVVNVTDR